MQTSIPGRADHHDPGPARRRLVLLRHGESAANSAGLFTGLLDVSLTATGRREAVKAAALLDAAGLIPDRWWSSPLVRARETAEIVSRRLRGSPHRIREDWRLAERNYGSLTGRAKSDVLQEHGESAFHLWRRSVDCAPPPMTAAFRSDHLERAPAFLGLTESLHDVIERVRAAWVGEIAPGLRPGSVTIVVAHGNSLRALCAVVDHLSDAEIEDLNLPTGQPLLYEFADGGSPLKRGGAYLDPDTALPAARRIAEQGGT